MLFYKRVPVEIMAGSGKKSLGIFSYKRAVQTSTAKSIQLFFPCLLQQYTGIEILFCLNA